MNAYPDTRRGLAVRIVLPLILLLAAVLPAAARERNAYSLEILVNGIPLTEYAARNTSYIEATEGAEYSIRLRNHSAERVAIALSVDGLNTIDAKETTARNAAKWILNPYETVTLDGWQTASNTARRFFFTTEDKSYGAWLGKTSNLGMISAAVFREQRRPQPILKQSRRSERSEGRRDAPSSPAPLMEREKKAGADTDAAGEAAELSEDLAATGIGREVEHQVRRVRFEAESSPTAVMELRYEYHDALVRLGVLPPSIACVEDPLTRREHARGFQDTDFAPDPFRRR